MKPPKQVPLRIDIAGGWLDVPRLSRPGAYIVNCAISPLVSLDHWPYEKNSGLGGSAAWSVLNGKDPVTTELDSGAGWQDAAIIQATGLCVWKSGPTPQLEYQCDGEMLRGRMGLRWTGKPHVTADLVNVKRNYEDVKTASVLAKGGVVSSSLDKIIVAAWMSYGIQLSEGMEALPLGFGIAQKFCGSGHGGYSLHLFRTPEQREFFASFSGSGLIPVEPYFTSPAPSH